MIANFLDYFYSDKYDNNIVIDNLSVKVLKTIVLKRINNLSSSTIPSELDCFEYIIEILARFFVEKDIYLDTNNCSNGIKLENFPMIDLSKVTVHFKTSGSSGEQKTIEKTLQNLVNESNVLKSQFPQLNGMNFISTTTPKHLFGFTFHFMLPLNSQGIINTKEISIPEDISIDNACLITTPSYLEKMKKYDNKPIVKPHYIFSAGAPLKSETFQYSRTIANNVVEIYGSTETGIVAHRENENSNFEIFKTVKVVPQQNSTIIETEFSTKTTFEINDKITLLKNNQIRIEGRTDRTFKIQEKRINAVEIETTLKQHKFISECYLTKIEDKLACLSVLNQDGQDYLYNNGIINLTKSLKKELRTNFEIIPQKWKFTDEIPTTRAGKIDKNEIENIFGLNLSIPLVVEKVIDKNCAKIRLYFYKNCNFFNGHFENFPIVPGVVQLFLAQYFSKKIFNIETSGQYKKIKFSNIIKPNKFIDLELELLSNSVSYKYVDENAKYSSGIIARK